MNIFCDGVRRRAEAPGPFLGVTVAAHRAAEALMETFREAGMPRSPEFVECLATIIDGFACLPEVIGALLLCHRMCQGLLRTDTVDARDLGVSPEMSIKIERDRMEWRRILSGVAARIEKAVGMVTTDAQEHGGIKPN
jgi:hypothetical protein